MSQIITVSNDEAIAEVALKCGDPFYKDFPQNIYSQAVYRAERAIAKEYGILDRIWSYTNTAGTSPIEITRLNFQGAFRVTVTTGDDVETLYVERKVDDILDNADSPTASTNYYYATMYNANTRYFYYTFPSENDVIEIYYTSSIAGAEDYEVNDADGNPNSLPVLPNAYLEETIRRAILYIAKLGVVTFIAEKANKYQRVMLMYRRANDERQEYKLERSRPWIKITPFQYP